MTTNFSSATVDLAEPVFSEQERPALAGSPSVTVGWPVRLRPEFYRGGAADWRIWGCQSCRWRVPELSPSHLLHDRRRRLPYAEWRVQRGVDGHLALGGYRLGHLLPRRENTRADDHQQGQVHDHPRRSPVQPGREEPPPARHQHPDHNLANLPDKLRAGQPDRTEAAHGSVLTPWEAGMRFECQRVHTKDISGPYAVVRWTDRWGQRWKHKKGEVRKIAGGEQWNP